MYLATADGDDDDDDDDDDDVMRPIEMRCASSFASLRRQVTFAFAAVLNV